MTFQEIRIIATFICEHCQYSYLQFSKANLVQTSFHLLTCEKHLHDHIISLKGEGFGLIKLVYPLHFLLKYVCQGVLNLRQFLGFSIRYWNCVVLFVFVFHFIFYQKKEMIKCTFEFERLDRLSVLSVL